MKLLNQILHELTVVRHEGFPSGKQNFDFFMAKQNRRPAETNGEENPFTEPTMRQLPWEESNVNRKT
jgi:hypothetical protein